MSNLDAFLGKMAVTNEIGEQLDKQLEQANNQAQQFFGGSAALKVGANKVSALGEHVDKDLEEGKLLVTTELEVAALIKKYLLRANEVLLNLAEKSKSEELVANGKVVAIRQNLELVQRHCVAAKSRAEQLMAAAEERRKAAEESPTGEEPVAEDRHRRVAGTHPGRSSLDERRAEAAKSREDVVTVEGEVTIEEKPAPTAGSNGGEEAAAGVGEGTPQKVTKKDFVLGLPFDLPAAEVVAKAQEAGMSLSTKYVYNVRGAQKGP